MAESAEPESVEAALAQAAHHARAAAAEALAALEALLQAGALAAGADPHEGRWAELAELLASARRWLGPGLGPGAAGALAALQQALDDEIRRWEERSRSEPDSRAVLRAFLAVREVLWEFGTRAPSPRQPAGDAGSADEPAGDSAALHVANRRVRRVRVQG